METVTKVDELINKLTPDVLEKLTVPQSTEIFQKEWFLGVTFEENSNHPIDLFRKRNQEIYKNRFAPEGVKVCYLANNFFRIADEIGFIGDAKRVCFNREPKLLNFDFNGPIRSEHTEFMKEKDVFSEISELVKCPRSPENYKNSCILAKYIFENGFNGIYYSPHPDAKYENSLIEDANKMAQKISPHFDFNTAYGPRHDPMLVIFEEKSLLYFVCESREIQA